MCIDYYDLDEDQTTKKHTLFEHDLKLSDILIVESK